MYEPPCGTNVVVYDPNHNTNRVLTKWDIGTLPNAVLDIRPYAFSNLFGYNLGDGHFWSRYGYYVQ